MSIGPLNQARGHQQVPVEEPGFTMTRATMAILVMWLGAVIVGVGAGCAWGWPQGLFAFGIMVSVYGVLLGIGS